MEEIVSRQLRHLKRRHVRFGSIPLKKAAVIPMYWRQRRCGQTAEPAVMRV